MALRDSSGIRAGSKRPAREEALRALLPERGSEFDIANVTGARGIEMDFPNDVTRAAQQVLPPLRRPAGVTR